MVILNDGATFVEAYFVYLLVQFWRMETAYTSLNV